MINYIKRIENLSYVRGEKLNHETDSSFTLLNENLAKFEISMFLIDSPF